MGEATPDLGNPVTSSDTREGWFDIDEERGLDDGRHGYEALLLLHTAHRARERYSMAT